MFGSRASQSFARRAAMSLGRNSGLQNASVRGGMFLQNCSITTSPSRMATLQQFTTNLQATGEALTSEMGEVMETLLVTDVPLSVFSTYCGMLPHEDTAAVRKGIPVLAS
ncbi:hypothetical protein DIPPA_15471 [Diplonema papillatum]|nr:hypothetical protein DIPPA_15471 [Diplonema papillatum]